MMERVIDWLYADLQDFVQKNSADGGVRDIVGDDIVVFWGDPGLIAVNNYPCFTVAPDVDESTGEGTTQKKFFELRLMVTFLIDAREFWDVNSPDEATGDRTVVRVGEAYAKRLAIKHKSLLDDMPDVRGITLSRTRYPPQPRGPVFAKSAEITLTIEVSRLRVV